jgi:hypothetical protein
MLIEPPAGNEPALVGSGIGRLTEVVLTGVSTAVPATDPAARTGSEVKTVPPNRRSSDSSADDFGFDMGGALAPGK